MPSKVNLLNNNEINWLNRTKYNGIFFRFEIKVYRLNQKVIFMYTVLATDYAIEKNKISFLKF